MRPVSGACRGKGCSVEGCSVGRGYLLMDGYVAVCGDGAVQVPGNMVITGCMMQFYKSIPAVIFWQV